MLAIFPWTSQVVGGSSVDIDDTGDKKSAAERFHWFDRRDSFHPTPFRGGVSRTRRAKEFSSDMRWLDCQGDPSDGREGFLGDSSSVCGRRLEAGDFQLRWTIKSRNHLPCLHFFRRKSRFPLTASRNLPFLPQLQGLDVARECSGWASVKQIAAKFQNIWKLVWFERHNVRGFSTSRHSYLPRLSPGLDIRTCHKPVPRASGTVTEFSLPTNILKLWWTQPKVTSIAFYHRSASTQHTPAGFHHPQSWKLPSDSSTERSRTHSAKSRQFPRIWNYWKLFELRAKKHREILSGR